MWLTCIDCLQQWNKTRIQKHIQSVYSFYTYRACKTRRKKPPTNNCRVECLVRLSGGLQFDGCDLRGKDWKGKGKKNESKNLENVIHCCKCNGQNVSRVSIVKPCVLFSVFL